jgi:hypothetical protein
MTTFANGGDNRIKFGRSVTLTGNASITLDITGGPLAAFQVAIFDPTDKLLNGIGFGTFGPVLTTEQGGHASWVFAAPQTAAYMKWGVQAFRSAANLTNYAAEVNVLDGAGNSLIKSSFAAAIPSNAFQDDIVYDGVNLTASPPAIPPGNSVGVGQ